jgi:hypothetical protein
MSMYNKFIVAMIMAGAGWLRQRYGLNLGMDESLATGLVGMLTAALVYAVPNKA